MKRNLPPHHPQLQKVSGKDQRQYSLLRNSDQNRFDWANMETVSVITSPSSNPRSYGHDNNTNNRRRSRITDDEYEQERFLDEKHQNLQALCQSLPITKRYRNDESSANACQSNSIDHNITTTSSSSCDSMEVECSWYPQPSIQSEDEILTQMIRHCGAKTYTEVVQFCVSTGIPISRMLRLDLMREIQVPAGSSSSL